MGDPRYSLGDFRLHLDPDIEAEIAPAVNQLTQRIKELEDEVARLKATP